MEINFKAANISDLDTLITFTREFNQEDHHPYDEAMARAGLIRLLNEPTSGQVWLIYANSKAAGYVVLTLGYRLAYGRYAFIDEIYVRSDYRSRGIGRQALTLAEAMCRQLGVKALHLEVELENTKARALYLAVGFVDYQHYLMTCWLTQNKQPSQTHSAEIGFQLAQGADIETLVNLRRESGAESRAALNRLVCGDSLGRVWLIQAGGEPVGYVIVTFSYSLEFHGRDALLDELYLRDPYRQNFAVASLKFSLAECLSLGVNAVHTEMERDNEPAQRLYRAAGFADDDSYLLTKWLER